MLNIFKIFISKILFKGLIKKHICGTIMYFNYILSQVCAAVLLSESVMVWEVRHVSFSILIIDFLFCLIEIYRNISKLLGEWSHWK